MKDLLKNKLVRSFMQLFSGDILVSILSIISIGFITKGLGLEKYGIVILIQGVVGLIDGLFNFQSWQGFIKFFSIRKESKEEIEKLIKFSYIQDIVTAFIAFLVLQIFAQKIGIFYNFGEAEVGYLRVLALGVIFNIQGTPIGILRSYGCYNKLRDYKVISGIINFILIFCGMYFQKGIEFYIYVYLFNNFLMGSLINYFALRVLQKENLLKFINSKINYDKEFFKFNCLTNINSSLDIPVQYLDNLLIGKFLSVEFVGVFKIAKTITLVLDKIGAPIYQILYPKFCEEINNNKIFEIKKLFLKSLGILSGISTILFLGLNLIGYDILQYILDKNILNYKNEINFYFLVKSFGIVFIAVHPLFLALGHIKKETIIVMIANLVYILLLYPLLRTFDLYGVIACYLIQISIIIFLKTYIVLKK